MQSYNKNIILSSIGTIGAATAFAADAAPTTAATGSSFNPVLISFAVIILILLFAIAVMGNVLRQLAIVYRNKLRSKNQIIKSIAVLIALSFSSLNAIAQEAAAEVAPVSTSISGIPKSDFYALLGIVILELLIVFAMMRYMRVMIKAIDTNEEAKAEAAIPVVKENFWDKFNAVVPIEKEKDIMLDHDYDGIKELDNSLPPWWKYGFYLTIVIGIIYLYYYHGGGNGPSSEQEFIAAVQKGEEDKAAYLAKTAGNIDENNVTLADATGIEEGKTLYAKNCAACHANDGGGLVGPNFTDEYWIHGGGLKDVFKSIKYGWQDKGMKSWKDDFSPKQIQSLSSYILSLKGTKPANPKEKQGELYVEATTAAATQDSTIK